MILNPKMLRGGAINSVTCPLLADWILLWAATAVHEGCCCCGLKKSYAVGSL